LYIPKLQNKFLGDTEVILKTASLHKNGEINFQNSLLKNFKILVTSKLSQKIENF